VTDPGFKGKFAEGDYCTLNGGQHDYQHEDNVYQVQTLIDAIDLRHEWLYLIKLVHGPRVGFESDDGQIICPGSWLCNPSPLVVLALQADG